MTRNAGGEGWQSCVTTMGRDGGLRSFPFSTLGGGESCRGLWGRMRAVRGRGILTVLESGWTRPVLVEVLGYEPAAGGAGRGVALGGENWALVGLLGGRRTGPGAAMAGRGGGGVGVSGMSPWAGYPSEGGAGWGGAGFCPEDRGARRGRPTPQPGI